MTAGKAIGHLAITASAGSGKTFQLAHRYIRLLAEGVAPEEIVALTFSRKAAGEIFDSIVSYLCEAAVSEGGALRLGTRTGSPSLTQATCLTLLKRLLDDLHRLRVGTLDSFSVSILRSFPFELGMTPGFDLMDSDSAAAEEMRRRILEDMLRGEGADSHTSRGFLEFFAQANEGRLDKQVQVSLASFITTYQSHLRALFDADNWGNPSVIWPDGTPWLDMDYSIESAVREMRMLLPAMSLPDEATQRWESFIAAAGGHTVYSPWGNELKYLFEKLAGSVTDLRSGSARVKLNRTVCDLSGDPARFVLALLTHVVRIELNASLTRTRGILGLLSTYERRYDAAMRRDGVLSFTDVQHLLAPSDENAGTRLSSAGGDSRLYIDYRLDARLNHWLLDEFQDTSDLQWKVLENLIDEVVQDDSGRRSLFYVGDVKQAIYGWRGGNPRLFDVPLSRYPGKIDVLPLHESFRSCPAIIDTVNLVFGDLAATGLPPRAVARWQHYWEPHRSAAGLAHVQGYASVLEPPCDGGALTPSPDDRYRVVAHLLNEMQPLARGLTVAVLVRSNDQGRALVDHLRGTCPGMTVVHEGRAAIKDNPVVAVLLALVTFTAHPGDLLAWRHLQMSPLQTVMDDMGLDRESLPLHILQRVQKHGFQQTLREWASRMDSVQRLDAFGRIRLEQFLAAAGELDVRGATSCDLFLTHITHYEIHDVAANDALRVMTVHQAKGLGFDIVILPELDRDNMLRARDARFILSRDTETQRPRWALELPRRAVAECDAVLLDELEQADADAAFESLCLLYVAMTRARRGLYLITSYPGKTSQLLNQPAFVKERLHGNTRAIERDGHPVRLAGEDSTCLYACGAERWFETEPVVPLATIPEVPSGAVVWPPEGTSIRTRLVAIRPSDSDALDASAAELFASDRKDRLDTGSAVHSLLERVTWSEEADVEAILVAWRGESEFDAATADRAAAHFRRAMSSHMMHSHLGRAHGQTALWRERHFDVVIDSRWITGSFDRVVIEQDERGSPLGATVYDFKTDDIAAADVRSRAVLYSRQMLLYRDALAHILHISPSRIRQVLLFTAPGVAFEFPLSRESVRRD